MNNILERMENLVKAIKKNPIETDEDKKDDVKNLEKYMLAFPNYLNAVIDYVIRGKIIGIWYDGEEYRDHMERLDRARRQSHIMAAEAVNKINRLATHYGVPKIFELDYILDSEKVEDRELAVNLTYRFCIDTFMDEVLRSGYSLTLNDLDAIILDMAEHKKYFETEIPKWGFPN